MSEYPCPVCGEKRFTWGLPASQGGVYFVEEGSFFHRFDGEGLRARKCNNCGNVLLFSKRHVRQETRKQKDDEYFY